jgi:hypothetical protein
LPQVVNKAAQNVGKSPKIYFILLNKITILVTLTRQTTKSENKTKHERFYEIFIKYIFFKRIKDQEKRAS